MRDHQECSGNLTPRENFLMSLLNKLVREYKDLLASTRQKKAFKIVDVLVWSSIPGETIFNIQVTNKHCVIQLSAGELIKDYQLNDFSDFHAEMIRKASQGKLIEFLKLRDAKPKYKIASKRFDAKSQEYIFTIQGEDNSCFNSTAAELARDKILLANIDMQDIFDIAYTQGAESVLKEKTVMLLRTCSGEASQKG